MSRVSHPRRLTKRCLRAGYLEEKIIPAVKAVHTTAYIERLASTCVSLVEAERPTLGTLDDDTVVSASSLSAALCAVLSCCYAIDSCCDVNLPYKSAFAVIRPPGHHAGANGPTVGPHRFAEISSAAGAAAKPAASAFSFVKEHLAPCDGMDCSQGFCLLNNAAIAARHALLNYPSHIKRVCIVDIDLHHGNGTEEIVRGWNDVMYVSLHGVGDHEQGKWFYPDTATTLQTEERLVNVPLPEGTTSAAYLAAFDAHVVPNVRRFSPDLVIISCGFDACTGDSPAHPGGYLQLDPAAYGEITSRLASLAHECSGGRLVSLFEGGYKHRPLAACARAHVAALAGLGDYSHAASPTTAGGTASPAASPAVGPPLAVGTPVRAKYKGKSREYPAVISKVHRDGSYDLEYSDGDKESHVLPRYVRPMGKGAASAAASSPAHVPSASAAPSAAAVPDSAPRVGAVPAEVPPGAWVCTKCQAQNEAGAMMCKVPSCNVPFSRFGLLSDGSDSGRRGRRAISAISAISARSGSASGGSSGGSPASSRAGGSPELSSPSSNLPMPPPAPPPPPLPALVPPPLPATSVVAQAIGATTPAQWNVAMTTAGPVAGSVSAAGAPARHTSQDAEIRAIVRGDASRQEHLRCQHRWMHAACPVPNHVPCDFLTRVSTPCQVILKS